MCGDKHLKAEAISWQSSAARERNKDLTILTTTFRLTGNFHPDKCKAKAAKTMAKMQSKKRKMQWKKKREKKMKNAKKSKV